MKFEEMADEESKLSLDDVDMINEAPHYATRNIQPNDYIDDLLDWNTSLTAKEGYYVGQIHRYMGRAGMKEGNAKLQDFLKAQYYVDRLIDMTLMEIEGE